MDIIFSWNRSLFRDTKLPPQTFSWHKKHFRDTKHSLQTISWHKTRPRAMNRLTKSHPWHTKTRTSDSGSSGHSHEVYFPTIRSLWSFVKGVKYSKPSFVTRMLSPTWVR